MSVNRQIENSTYDARYRADIVLPTGKTVTLTSDWKPSHWDAVEDLRKALVRDSIKRARAIEENYGITGEIRLCKETRHLVRVVEETITSTFHSSHYLTQEKKS